MFWVQTPLVVCSTIYLLVQQWRRLCTSNLPAVVAASVTQILWRNNREESQLLGCSKFTNALTQQTMQDGYDRGVVQRCKQKRKKWQIFYSIPTTWYGNTCNRTKNLTWRKKGTTLTQSSSHNAHCGHVLGDMGRHAHRYGTDTL